MSAATYTAIIAAIDAAILNWAGEPVVIEQGGKKVEYRKLDDLLKARKTYAQLLSTATRGKTYRIQPLRNGGAA